MKRDLLRCPTHRKELPDGDAVGASHPSAPSDRAPLPSVAIVQTWLTPFSDRTKRRVFGPAKEGAETSPPGVGSRRTPPASTGLRLSCEARLRTGHDGSAVGREFSGVTRSQPGRVTPRERADPDSRRLLGRAAVVEERRPPVGRDVADESPAQPGHVARIVRPAPHGQTDRLSLRGEEETVPGGGNALEREEIGQDVARPKLPRGADGPESAVFVGRLGGRSEPDLARLRAPVEAGDS